MNGLVSRLASLASSIGFRMQEVMRGTHEFEPGCGPPGRHPMELRVTWGPERLERWLSPASGEFMTQPLEGAVTVGGLCENAPCEGRLELRYRGEHRIRYDFEFEADGRRYRYVGEKVNIRPWNLPFSHTTCFGRVTEAGTGRLVSTSTTIFELESLPGFLLSFRLTRAPEAGPTTPNTAA